MKKSILLLFIFIMILASGCVYSADNSFFIDVGNKDNQIGCKEVDYAYVSPRAISGNGNFIYILDVANFKVNVYSKLGQFKKSYKILNNISYYDLNVDSKGKIYLLTDKGIYIISSNDKVMKKLYPLPAKMSIPYYFYIDNLGNIAISGGGITGIIDAQGTFKELKGNDIFMTGAGLVGLQTLDDHLTATKNGKIMGRFKIYPDYLSIGFSEDMSIYFAKPSRNKDKMEIRRVQSNGKSINKAVEYNFELTCDPMSYLQVLDVTQEGEVILLDLADKGKKVKVSIVNL